MRIIAAALAAALCAGCAQVEPVRVQSTAPLTAEHFRQTASIKDDSLETIATISTRPGNDTRAAKVEWVDAFVRALVTKRNGETSVQLVVETRYPSQWRFYTSANFATPTGPQSKLLIVADRKIDGCRVGCSYYEAVTFMLTEKEAREIAAMQVDAWAVKLTPRIGADLFVNLPMAELRGLLARVDDYRAKR